MISILIPVPVKCTWRIGLFGDFEPRNLDREAHVHEHKLASDDQRELKPIQKPLSMISCSSVIDDNAREI